MERPVKETYERDRFDEEAYKRDLSLKEKNSMHHL